MKKLLFFVAALLLSVPGFAQSDDGEEEFIPTKEKSNAFFIGLKAGGTMTSMTQPDEGKLYDASDFGFSGGLVLKARFGKASENSVGGTGYFGAGLELKYKLNSVKTLGTEAGKKMPNFLLDTLRLLYTSTYILLQSHQVSILYILS